MDLTNQILISSLTFVVGMLLGGAGTVVRGLGPVKERLAILTTEVAVVEKKVGEIAQWIDRWEDRLYEAALSKAHPKGDL